MPPSKKKRQGLTDSWGRRNREIPDKICEACGIKFRPVNSKLRTCSRKCGYIIRKNPQENRKKKEVWWINKRGYIEGRVRIDGTARRVRQHRYFMELHLKRRLDRSEDVHHIDENKLNNAISNLKLISHGKHSSYHNNKRVYKKGYKLNLSTHEIKRRSLHMKEIVKKYRNSNKQ